MPKPMKNLLSLNQNQIVDFCQKNGISFLGVFGSYAKGKATAESDIDLLVRFSQNISLLDLVRLENALSNVLGKRVDLVTESSISPYLKKQILLETQKIYERA